MFYGGGQELSVVNDNGIPVPVGFFGEVLRRENGCWYRTGKAGRILPEGRLELSGERSRVIELDGRQIDLKQAEEALSTRYPAVRSTPELFEGRLIWVLSGTRSPITLRDFQDCCGFLPDLLFATDHFRRQSVWEHLQRTVTMKRRLADRGYEVIAIQEGNTDQTDIILLGDTVPDGRTMEAMQERIRDDRIVCYYSDARPEAFSEVRTLADQNVYRYPGRKKSGTERELIRIWQEILGHDAFGIYDHFYEVGGDSVRVLALSDAISGQFGVEVPIAVLFDCNTIFDLGAVIDRRKGEAVPGDGQTLLKF